MSKKEFRRVIKNPIENVKNHLEYISSLTKNPIDYVKNHLEKQVLQLALVEMQLA